MKKVEKHVKYNKVKVKANIERMEELLGEIKRGTMFIHNKTDDSSSRNDIASASVMADQLNIKTVEVLELLDKF